MEYQQVQQIARYAMNRIRKEVCAGMSLAEVRDRCEKYMLEAGADSFWYYDVGAFVFCGDQTAFSASGRTYQTPDSVLRENDILTIDLSPQNGDTWGDYARTIILQNGKPVDKLDDIRIPEWRNGLEMEEKLHQELVRIAAPEMTFEELYEHMNHLIRISGFLNLDFSGNLGHSIVRRREDRIYIEKGNKHHLGEVLLFTFEPHISIEGSLYGYKKENIYFFENGILKEL